MRIRLLFSSFAATAVLFFFVAAMVTLLAILPVAFAEANRQPRQHHHHHSHYRQSSDSPVRSRFAKGGRRGAAALETLERAPEAEALLRNLSFAEQLRELSQFDIQGVMLKDRNSAAASPGFGYGWIDEAAVIKLLQENKVGSFFNSPSSGPNCPNGCPVPPVKWHRQLQYRLWELSRTYGSAIPILYGIDSIHGANYVWNATIFPQQINAAATFNTTVARRLGEVSGRETRYAGIPWVFSPVLGIAVQPSWARVFETFGEDPLLVSRMGVAIISGYQQKPSEPTAYPNWKETKANYTVAACAKHFVGYPDSRTGRDRTPVSLPYNTLLQYFLPPFEAAVNEANVLSMMENYIELNGKPVVASNLLLDFLLRGQQELNFQNMLVTDYNEIFNLYDFHKYSASHKDAIYDSLNQTTIDMAMVSGPNDFDVLVTDELSSLLSRNKMDPQRLQTSARRVLELKARLGLIDDERLNFDSTARTIADVLKSGATSPVPPPQTAWEGSGCSFGCKEHREAALDAARQSIVLLQNEPVDPVNNPTGPKVLPLVGPDRTRNIAVVGQACDSKGLMSGGWTVHWQGTSNESELPTGSTILQELRSRLLGKTTANITYSKGCNVTENSECGESFVAETLLQTKAASVVILCIGERHYAEKPGDIFDIGLPGGQKGLVQQIVDGGVPKENIVVVLIQGRPRLLGSIPQQVGAILHGFLPGPHGGEAIVDILLGKVNPSGKLPITYPKTYNGAPIQYWRKASANTDSSHTGDNDYLDAIQWPFGHGLSYTMFVYSGLNVQLNGNNIEVQVTVTNVGGMNGSEAVLVYSTQTFRRITPEVQMLRAFEKVHLTPFQSATVAVQFSYSDLGYFDETNCMQFDSSPYTIIVGGLRTTQNITADNVFMTVPLQHAMCAEWGRYFLDHQSGPPQFPTPPPVVQGNAEDYFIASIVCFGAGIVITSISIVFIRKRRNTSNENNLLEPAGV